MRILHTSDWHLGKMLENISRIGEQKDFVQELCTIAEEEKVNLVLIAGDIFDTYNPSAAAEELFYEAINALSNGGKRAVVVIAGNHDSPDRLCAASSLAMKNGIVLAGYPYHESEIQGSQGGDIQICAAGKGWFELKIKGCKHSAVVIVLPYPSESRLDQVLAVESDELQLAFAYSDKISEIIRESAKNFREDTVNLLAAHLFMRDGKHSDSERQLGGALLVDPAALPENAHYIALGHLHRPQSVKNSPVPAKYSGSPLAYSFSEVNYSKAVYVVDAEPGRETEIKEVHLNAGKPLKQWIAKNGIEEAMQWCEAGRDATAWIDLEIYTDRVITPEEQKMLRELSPGIINIRPRLTGEGTAEISRESREGRRIDELFADYYTHRLGIEASDELMNAFLEVLNGFDEEDILEEEFIAGGVAVEA